MIRFYASDSLTAPEAVECAEVGYPNSDARGRVQYDNTHFDTEDEAWERLVSDAAAWVSLTGDDVQHARSILRHAEEKAGRAAEHFAAVTVGARKFRRQRSAEPEGSG